MKLYQGPWPWLVDAHKYQYCPSCLTIVENDDGQCCAVAMTEEEIDTIRAGYDLAPASTLIPANPVLAFAPDLQTDPCPYVVVGDFRPGKGNYYASLIGEKLVDMAVNLGLNPLSDPNHGPQESSTWISKPMHAEVRRFAQPHGLGSSWHQDGDLADGSIMNHAELLWAAVTPTQFKTLNSGTIYQPRRFEIVLARNLACYHRTPPDAPMPPERRWFFRMRCNLPTHIQLP